MIRKLMALSRRADLRRVPTDLAAVAADLSGILRRLFPATIHIEIKSDDVLPVVGADAGAVQQMLMNLATNARDAMPKGGTFFLNVERVSLEAEEGAKRDVEPGDYTVIRVRDTGTGMDAETKARLFEPFFTTKGPEKGTGLGMAMIFGLMDQHDGFIHVESGLGQGTTISLYFPTISETVAGPVASDGPVEVARGTETILLAEDENALRRAGKRALEILGYRVLVAADGEEALEVFKARQPDIDLVISDVVMPKMGGADLLRAIRSIAPDIKFLFASGYGSADLATEDQILQTAPSLQKPWTIDELAGQVRSVLDQRSAS